MAMHILRTSSRLARLVLAWFAFTVLVAGGSPLVHPQAMELVCSADGGIKLVIAGEDGKAAAPSAKHMMDCALCLPVSPPPVPVRLQVPAPSPLAHALLPVAAAHIAAWAGAPLPPRGPPRI